MKKLLTLTLIMLMALSLVLVSCSPNADKTEGEKMDDKTEKLITTGFSGLSTSISDVASVADEKSETYSQNETFKIVNEDGSAISIIDSTDAEKYNSGKSYVDSTELTADGDGSGSTSVAEKDKVSATQYEYIQFEIKSKNSKDDSGKISTKEEFVLTFKVKQAEDEEQTNEVKLSSVDNEENFLSSSLYKECKALLKLYCPENQEFTFDETAITKILSLLDGTPHVTITKDFGTSVTKRGVLEAELALSCNDNKEMFVKIVSAKLTLKDSSYTDVKEKIIFEIPASPEEVEMKLSLSSDFRMAMKVSIEEDGIKIDPDGDDFKGTAKISFKEVPVKVLDEKFDFIVDGTLSYNFETGAVTMDATVSEQKLYLSFGFAFNGNLKEAQNNNDDWTGFMEGFEITSFKFMGKEFDPSTVSSLFATYKDLIIDFLEANFGTETSVTPAGKDL